MPIPFARPERRCVSARVPVLLADIVFVKRDPSAEARDAPALRLGAWRIATPICYEAVRPEFVRRMAAQSRPHLLVTLANDAWFGDPDCLGYRPGHILCITVSAVPPNRPRRDGRASVVQRAPGLLACGGLQRGAPDRPLRTKLPGWGRRTSKGTCDALRWQHHRVGESEKSPPLRT
jgi:hypothetical protein